VRTYILGLDPGLDGGLAVYSFDPVTQEENITAAVMPTVETKTGKREIDAQGVINFFKTSLPSFDPRVVSLAVIERVTARPDQGVTSMFNFGMGYGMLVGCLVSANLNLVKVIPQTWKKVILPNTDKDKTAAISFIQKKFPKLNLKRSERCRTLHDGMADACCLAVYGKYVVNGKA
jgi:crossover junction endodeoxyribonuclease RuvC